MHARAVALEHGQLYAECTGFPDYPDRSLLVRALAQGCSEKQRMFQTYHAAPDDVAERIGRHLVIRPSGCEGSLGTERLDATVREDALGMLAAGTTGFLHYGGEGERLGEGLDVFVASYAPPAQMFVFGAIDFSAS